ncbi:Serine/threonine-protein kinase STY46 [Senna tora]|uniref:Serine/threonine-protein kinase STY46 n=1 Tax=Senna tora TaxID=362788 RepID=A0A834SFR8_9FABA|nr:Serine/threonine-protein kinase STY46 [Senna tora]
MAVRGSWVERHREHAPVLPTRAPNLPALHAGVKEEGTSRATFPDCEPIKFVTRMLSNSLVPVENLQTSASSQMVDEEDLGTQIAIGIGSQQLKFICVTLY